MLKTTETILCSPTVTQHQVFWDYYPLETSKLLDAMMGDYKVIPHLTPAFKGLLSELRGRSGNWIATLTIDWSSKEVVDFQLDRP